MKRIIKLTENDLIRIVKRVIKEQKDDSVTYKSNKLTKSSVVNKKRKK